MAAIAYFILAQVLIHLHGRNTTLTVALGSDFKGKASIVFYVLAIPLAFVSQWLALAIYALVAALWFIPDRRIENTLHD